MECSICLQDVQDTEAITKLPACGHKFHTSCLLSLIQYNVSHADATVAVVDCPLCRSPIITCSRGASAPSPTTDPPHPHHSQSRIVEIHHMSPHESFITVDMDARHHKLLTIAFGFAMSLFLAYLFSHLRPDDRVP
jgi:hypothetical protein